MRLDLTAILGNGMSPLSCLHHLLRNMAVDDFLFPLLIIFSSLALLLCAASSAVVDQSPSSSLNLDLSSSFDCVSLRDWIGTNYIASDCQQAIRRFIHEEVFVHMDHELEFLAPGASPLHTLPTVATPRRYTVGSSNLTLSYNISSILLIFST